MIRTAKKIPLQRGMHLFLCFLRNLETCLSCLFYLYCIVAFLEKYVNTILDSYIV